MLCPSSHSAPAIKTKWVRRAHIILSLLFHNLQNNMQFKETKNKQTNKQTNKHLITFRTSNKDKMGADGEQYLATHHPPSPLT